MADDIGPGLYFQNLIDIMNQLKKLGVKLYPKHRLTKIRNGKAIFEIKESDEQKEYQFEVIVISLGIKPNQELTAAIKSSFEKVYLLGDAAKVGKIRDAMESGFLCAYNL
jgi:NADH dehydrogenase FAD-containing subunit